MKLYQLIYSYPLDIAPSRVYTAGIYFFIQNGNIEDIAEKEEWTIEVVKGKVREFVGVLYQKIDYGSVCGPMTAINWPQ